ncbi:MAG: adenylosuccinate synthase [Anaerolineae bacterium]|nr:adenylosuccinate synthase [Anaerolineae bacterium]
MPLTIVIGTQWGDEGKGRIVDLLSAEAQLVARYSGGDNAGHTVTVGRDIFKLHQIPSGIIHAHTVSVLGNGMVINPNTLSAEIDLLTQNGIHVSPQRLAISHAAHLITPMHRLLDQAQDEARGASKIGTTGRGIGPAYVDKAARRGLRAQDILDPASFREKLTAHVQDVKRQMQLFFGSDVTDEQSLIEEYAAKAISLAPYIRDTGALVRDYLSRGMHVLAEGAQGTLLDLDQGTYPYVTSSCTTAAGVFSGLGIGVQQAGRVVGITKAFQTRVGSGPFPTELLDETAGRLRGSGANPWDEFGTTTGRPRRVGWLDGVLLRYAVAVNGVSELALTKLDILSGFSVIKICTAYRVRGKDYEALPDGLQTQQMQTYQPVYEELHGWEGDIRDVRRWEDLPSQAQQYVHRIAQIAGVPVRMVSVGPEREQVIYLA